MIKFDIKNHWTGNIQFTAEIDCAEDAEISVKVGLSVKWALKADADLAGANLAGADLAGADLVRADLADADLVRANLAGANLVRAYLVRANLAGADLAGANLAGAYLAGAYLAGANLAGANLAGANLADADLADADLADADLVRANLAGADLAGAYLNGASGLNAWVKCIQVEDWPISYTSDVMQIGCQRHSFDAWRGFSDAEIRAMDGRKALTFWKKWRETIFQIVEMAPAKPTKSEAEE